jgi:hypothetical protein
MAWPADGRRLGRLEDDDCLGWEQRRLWPGAMVGAFDAEVRHLAFDHAGEGSEAAGGEQPLGDLGGDAGQRGGLRLRGEGRLAGGGDLTTHDPHAAEQRQPVGVELVVQAAWCISRRMAWWTSSMPQTSWVTISGERERSTTLGPRWWVLSSSRVVANSHRWWSRAASSAAGAWVGSRMVVSSR